MTILMVALVGWAQADEHSEAISQAALNEALRADNRVESLQKLVIDYPTTLAAPSSLTWLSQLDRPNGEKYLRQILQDYPGNRHAIYAEVQLLKSNPENEPKVWLKDLERLSVEVGGPSLLQVLKNSDRPSFTREVRRLPLEKRLGLGYLFVEAQSKLATAMGRREDSIRLARFNRVTFEQPNALQKLIIDFPDPTPNYNLHPKMESWEPAVRKPEVRPPSIDEERRLLVIKIVTFDQASIVDLGSLRILLDSQDVRPSLAVDAEFDLTYSSNSPLEVLTMELPLKHFEKGLHHLSIQGPQIMSCWEVEF